MSAIIHYLRTNKRIDALQDIVAQTAMELWPDHPITHLAHAITAGQRAIANGFDLIESLNECEKVLESMKVTDRERDICQKWKNTIRKAKYKMKRDGLRHASTASSV